METYKNFIKKNKKDLENMYEIIKENMESFSLTFISFCKFCYENSV